MCVIVCHVRLYTRVCVHVCAHFCIYNLYVVDEVKSKSLARYNSVMVSALGCVHGNDCMKLQQWIDVSYAKR